MGLVSRTAEAWSQLVEGDNQQEEVNAAPVRKVMVNCVPGFSFGRLFWIRPAGSL